MWTSGTLLKNRHHRTDLQGRKPLPTPCGSHSRLPGRGRGASAVFEIQPDDVMQEFRVDQHVEADRHLLGLARSEEHTSELQSLMRISYAVFCLTKKKTTNITNIQ